MIRIKFITRYVNKKLNEILCTLEHESQKINVGPHMGKIILIRSCINVKEGWRGSVSAGWADKQELPCGGAGKTHKGDL